ncbi:hypothetical protein ACFW7K_09470 [Streptomyces sp. NPDC058735]|uniref:hypothetical protein n=1 Tax=Streptomyces sp. NPDC058735 TaxID=3346616 RepID=UPI0036AC974E
MQALQHPGKIAEVLKLVTEKKVWYEAAGCINNEFFQGRTAFNEKMLRGRYLEITQRRNKIAHDADLIDGDLKQRPPHRRGRDDGPYRLDRAHRVGHRPRPRR